MREIYKIINSQEYRFCRFDNGFGAEIHIQSYNTDETPLWTLTVLRFDGPGWDDYYPCTTFYSKLLEDILFYYLNEGELIDMLTRIRNLSDPTPLLTSMGFF